MLSDNGEEEVMNMLILIIQLIQLLLVIGTVAAMVLYRVWYNKPPTPPYYRTRRKACRAKAGI